MFYTWVQNCTLIESFFNKILKSNMASDACFSSNVEYRAVIRYLLARLFSKKTSRCIVIALASLSVAASSSSASSKNFEIFLYLCYY